jgi:hypothetical protein
MISPRAKQPLNLGLVHSIQGEVEEHGAEHERPKGVHQPWVWIKTGRTHNPVDQSRFHLRITKNLTEFKIHNAKCQQSRGNECNLD